MRFSPKPVVMVIVLVLAALVLAQTLAFAQCPPGTRWSNRAWRCVPAGPPPPPPGAYYPPPGGYYPPPGGYYPPPPPPPVRGGCNQSYQNCLYVCAGVPQCMNNCNIGYSMCVGGS